MILESPKINILQEIIAPYKASGFIKGYFKGFSINLIKGPLANSVSFTTRDILKKYSSKDF
jgi:hypothetical protein